MNSYHSVTFQFVQTNGITLNVAIAGDAASDLVILLHGFPQYWKSWDQYIDPLVNAGYLVYIPDQRGYNLSDKPKEISSYKIEELCHDIIGLIDHAKKETAIIVGHDWGAVVAWHLAGTFQERISKVIAINVPHPKVLSKTLKSNIKQILQSWYIFFFQIKGIPVWALKFGNFYFLRRTMVRSSRKGTFNSEDLEGYIKAWSQEKSIPSMINWYRASGTWKGTKKIELPVLIIWGQMDKFLVKQMAQRSLAYCNNGILKVFDNATHWVINEEFEKVSELIIDFIK